MNDQSVPAEKVSDRKYLEYLAVTCPACQAPAGKPCTVATDTGRRPVTWVHNARRDAAEGWT